MASKGRLKGNRWEYVVKRTGLLDRPLYLSFESKRAGDAYCRNLEKLLDKGIIPPEHQVRVGQVTLGSVIDQYLKAVAVSGKDQEYLSTVSKAKGATSCLAIDSAWVDAWVQEMKHEQKYAPATIRAKIGATARATDWAIRRKLIVLPEHPFRTLPEGYSQYSEWDGQIAGVRVDDEERERRIEAGEEERIRAVLSKGVLGRKQRPYIIPHLGSTVALFDLALESAMRLREMYTLTVDQVNLKGRDVFLSKTKNGDSRQVPLSSVAVRVLTEQCRGKTRYDLVFPWLAEQRPGKNQKKMTTNFISKILTRVFTEAGCVDLKPHDLRHEAVSRMFERTDWKVEKIMKVAGHKSHKMFMRYMKLRSSGLADGMW